MEKIQNLGRFIVIEGLDGSGKDTQAELLHRQLPKSFLGFAPTRTGELQKIIRTELKESSLKKHNEEFLSHLMYCDRLYQTWNTTNGIYKILEEERDYISVRYHLSSLVYNKHPISIKKLLPIDILIFLDLEPEKSLDRIKRRAKIEDTELERYENLEKLKESRKKYLEKIEEIKNDFPDTKILKIDASKGILEINKEIINFINMFGKGKR